MGPAGKTTRPEPSSAAAWLAHLDILRHFISSDLETALILEDDVDWDLRIKDQMRLVSDNVRAFGRSYDKSGHQLCRFLYDALGVQNESNGPMMAMRVKQYAEKYIWDFYKLATRANLDEAMKAIGMHKPRSWQEAVEAAREAYELRPRERAGGHRGGRGGGRGGQVQGRAGQVTEARLCFNCNSPEHIARNCPQPPRTARRPKGEEGGRPRPKAGRRRHVKLATPSMTSWCRETRRGNDNPPTGTPAQLLLSKAEQRRDRRALSLWLRNASGREAQTVLIFRALKYP
ncbi:hypothetical protein Micbo1qcDRAFT_181341 [Microdochium bolleyi]|uniref:CCHC-type domain-containing protein n=1 Tax=Microdochium bolleyi TaxID=196109 RepID=A0A136IJ98_9PEZI|nr:hypothetical protein Micbo1qcDRAFT_181341 [Microdochium bolleyi]